MKQIKITSSDNEKIKLLRKLKLKKYRDDFSLYFIENLTIIHDGVNAGINFDSLFVTEEFLIKNKDFESILTKSKITEYYLITEKINKSFSNLENPSGVCAIYDKIKKEINYNYPVVYLNGISDPGNLGTIIRSAAAFEFPNIVLDETCADVYNYKTIQAAKEAIFKVNLDFDKNLSLLKEIKRKMPIFSTRLEESGDISILRDKKKFCLVFGNETHGVDPKIQELSDGFIKIKISGKIESLNVASSAAIIFHSVYSN